MRVHLNGTETDLPKDCSTLQDLIAAYGGQNNRILAELNGTVIPKSSYGNTFLSEGDRIELVHFVGGG